MPTLHLHTETKPSYLVDDKLSNILMQVHCDDEQIAAAFRLHYKTLRRGCGQARQHLLALAQQFPWFAGLTERTVMTRAQQLIQADSLRRSAQAKSAQQSGKQTPMPVGTRAEHSRKRSNETLLDITAVVPTGPRTKRRTAPSTNN